jgi:hypothetical protein
MRAPLAGRMFMVIYLPSPEETSRRSQSDGAVLRTRPIQARPSAARSQPMIFEAGDIIREGCRRQPVHHSEGEARFQARTASNAISPPSDGPALAIAVFAPRGATVRARSRGCSRCAARPPRLSAIALPQSGNVEGLSSGERGHDAEPSDSSRRLTAWRRVTHATAPGTPDVARIRDSAELIASG